MTPETQKKLEELSAKELKAIAKNANLEFDGMANVAQMLEVLSKAGITGVPATPDAPTNGEDGADGSDDGSGVDPTSTNTADGEDAHTGDEDERNKVDDEVGRGRKWTGKFTVLSSIKRNGIEYKVGQKIVFENNTDEVAELVASGVIK